MMAARILIVEDNQHLSEFLAICLMTAGYGTSLARDSSEGISKALHDPPDLILTDLSLPDMTAVEAATILKKDPITSSIPIVILTGVGHTDWKVKALKAGAAEYLIKPVSPPDLLRIVAKLCRQPRLVSEL
jgi:two-component system, OmpR family, phosphate regulon response regulator PhoB